MKRRVIDQIHRTNQQRTMAPTVTVGTVIDVNDPQQLGRVRILCPAFGDSPEQEIRDIPWASNGCGIIGNTFVGTRGPNDGEENTTSGGVTYGFRTPIQIGAQAIVVCIDDDVNHRVWIGTLQPSFTNNTMPHGRFSYQTGSGEPDGPLSTEEGQIQPLYDNQTIAFTSRKDNFEWRTRGADYNMLAMREDLVDKFKTSTYSDPLPDDREIKFTEKDGNVITHTQGYGDSRLLPDLKFSNTYDKHKNPTVAAWTTPGFHSISMDDRIENCRMRFRTSSGHQVLMDDTNERIYISTAEGRNWVEMDQDGNIDIYSKVRISIHSEGEINLTSDKTVRMFGKEGVHIHSSEGQVRMFSFDDLHIKTQGNMFCESSSNTHIKSGSNIFTESVAALHLKSGNVLNLQSSSTMNLKAGGNILQTGAEIHFNGPVASNATVATNAELSFYTNRVPAHEPWARTITLNDNTHDPKYDYNSPNIGKEEGFSRGKYWHR